MTATTSTDASPSSARLEHHEHSLRPAGAAARSAFAALLLRDLTVLRKNLKEFIPRTIMQPLLLMFIFTYVFPKIGQGIGGGGKEAADFSTLLVAGVVGLSIIFQGIQAVALPMVQEFGYTKEIEDRVLAPTPLAWVAVAKIVSGALQALIAALLVFPIAAVVPATPVNLRVSWVLLLTLGPLTAVCGASLGLFFGTRFEPRQVPILFGIIIVPLTFLGCVYYPWQSLSAIPWLKWAVLFNPLVYFSEGFRASLTPAHHMNLALIYLAIIGFIVLLAGLGIRQFKGRVLT